MTEWVDVAFDLETWRTQPGRKAPRLVCLSWYDGQMGGVLHRDSPGPGIPSAVDFFEDLLLNHPSVRFIGHKVTFDVGVMVNERPRLMGSVFEAFDKGRIVDTMIRQILRKIAQGNAQYDMTFVVEEGDKAKKPKYGLEDLTQELLGESIEGKHGPDAWRFRYHELDQVPVSQWPPEARQYSELDSVYGYRVWQKFLELEQIEEEQAGLRDLENQCRHAWWMHLMEAWGARSDPYAVDQLEAEIQHNVNESMPRLIKAGIFRPDGSKNMKVLMELTEKAYALSGREAPRTKESKRFAEGQIQTSKEVLADSGDELLKVAAEVASEKSILTGAIPLLRKAQTVPFNPWWNVLKATGRTSCGGEDDPGNLQNQRRRGGVRECWVPRAGWIFVDADYHAAELCSLAQILLDKYGESEMASAILAGRELHLDMAATILDISYEECVARHKKKDKEVKDARQLSKAANFGLPGGLGPEKFKKYAKDTYDVILTLERAKEIKQIWLEKFPEMSRYFADMSLAVAYGPTKIIHHRSGRIRGGVGYCDGNNSYFQGLTADGAKAAGYEIARECYAVPSSPLYGCRIFAFIHDEFILEAPIPQARAAAKRLSEIMVEQMMRYTPDIPSKAEAALMRRWYKEAEPEFNAQGLLVPWEPTHPGKGFGKALKAKDMQPEDFAEASGLALSEVIGVMQCQLSMNENWYDKLVRILGGKHEDWRAPQRQWGLEQQAKIRDAALGYPDSFWLV